MNLRVFYGPKKYKVRLPPEYESEDRKLSDSDGDDPEHIPPLKKTNRFASILKSMIVKSLSARQTHFRWKRNPVPVWSGALPASTDIKSPFDYFNHYFEDILDFIVKQSNIYAVQQNHNRPLRLDRNILEQFLGCFMLMLLYNLPRSHMYWEVRTRISHCGCSTPGCSLRRY